MPIWPLTDIQTIFINDATQNARQAQQGVQQRLGMILKELAEARNIDPTQCAGKLTDAGEGKLAFTVEFADKSIKVPKLKA